MHQRALSNEGFEKFRKSTRREKFLDEMNQVIPGCARSSKHFTRRGIPPKPDKTIQYDGRYDANRPTWLPSTELNFTWGQRNFAVC
jgi:hypothetical protein